MAAVHRGTVNLALRGLVLRQRLNERAYDKGQQLADDMLVLANNTKVRAKEVRLNAATKFTANERKLLAAENLVLNAKDDLNKFTTNV